jgi:hypothetical protein
MRAYGEVDVYIHTCFTSTLVGSEFSASRPCHFTPVERAPGTHWLGGCMGPRAGLDNVKKRKFLTLLKLEMRPLGRPARNQSLYQLSYPGSSKEGYSIEKLASVVIYQNGTKLYLIFDSYRP